MITIGVILHAKAVYDIDVEDLRLQLLDGDKSHHLVKSLYGLLMLLPQSDAFRTLQRRLQCIPATSQLASTPTTDQRFVFAHFVRQYSVGKR